MFLQKVHPQVNEKIEPATKSSPLRFKSRLATTVLPPAGFEYKPNDSVFIPPTPASAGSPINTPVEPPSAVSVIISHAPKPVPLLAPLVPPLSCAAFCALSLAGINEAVTDEAAKPKHNADTIKLTLFMTHGLLTTRA